MISGEINYVLDDVVILYRLCMVFQMYAHNNSVQSDADSERMLLLLCLLLHSYCIGLYFLRIYENAVQNYKIAAKYFCVNMKNF